MLRVLAGTRRIRSFPWLVRVPLVWTTSVDRRGPHRIGVIRRGVGRWEDPGLDELDSRNSSE